MNLNTPATGARFPTESTTTNYRRVLGATTLVGDRVVNPAGEDLGKLHELMIDTHNGRVAYAVLSFGGFLGLGDKLFAIPWNRITVDEVNKQLVLDVDREVLERAPGFDKDNWPDMAEPAWGSQIYSYYNTRPYWESNNDEYDSPHGDVRTTTDPTRRTY